MVDLEKKTIAWASMTCIMDLDAYEFTSGDEIVFNDVYLWMTRLYIIHMIGVHYSSTLYLYVYVNGYIWT